MHECGLFEAAMARFESANINDERLVRAKLALTVYSGKEFDEEGLIWRQNWHPSLHNRNLQNFSSTGME